jgi:hypothetical protein
MKASRRPPLMAEKRVSVHIEPEIREWPRKNEDKNGGRDPVVEGGFEKYPSCPPRKRFLEA